ncbi:MAG: DUF2029 domain-containing protein [Phycisphaerae bacterium]|nr:DUF2029 domain-containing protein [Phycisphaerae bacterium]
MKPFTTFSPIAGSVGSRPSRRLMLIGFAIVAPTIQAALFLSRANENFQIGMDFRLTYTVAVAWAQGADPYDDDVLKRVWARQGMPHVTPPGLPQTPNVYPLTVATLLWPLAALKYPHALVVWMAINAACVAILLMQLLTVPTRSPVLVLAAVCVFLVGFPLRYGFSFGNLAVITTFLVVQVLRSPNQPLRAGVFLGLALVKYSLCGPLALFMAVTGRWRTVAVACVVQAILIAVATFGPRLNNPTNWIGPMLATADQSLRPGQPNHHATLAYTALHLELPSLLYRFSPRLDSLRHFGVGVLVITLIAGLVRNHARSRRAGPPRQDDTPPTAMSLEHVAILAVTLLAFYHRTYDLIVVIFPLLVVLVTTHTHLPGLIRAGLWAAAALTALPGASYHGGSPMVPWVGRAIIQPVATWALLAIAVLTIARLLARPVAPAIRMQ